MYTLTSPEPTLVQVIYPHSQEEMEASGKCDRDVLALLKEVSERDRELGEEA
jgi:hypothetical protein